MSLALDSLSEGSYLLFIFVFEIVSEKGKEHEPV